MRLRPNMGKIAEAENVRLITDRYRNKQPCKMD
jgi:hypothetical protein